MSFKLIESNFITSDNTRLLSRVWISENFDPDKVIVFHHGLGEHSNRYKNLLNFFEQENFSFFTYDARGHGGSSGERGDAENILRLVLDLEEYLYNLKQEYKISKPILLGHSLGGLIVSYFTVRHTNQEEIKALILSAPALEISLNLKQNLKLIIGNLIYFVKPDLILKSEINPDFLSHDKEIVSKYKNDHLVHPFLSVRLGLDILPSIEYVQKRAYKIKIPVWIGHGTNDYITSFEGSKLFFSKLASNNKKLTLYNGLYHEIFNEVTNIPLHDLKEWILDLK